MQFYIFPVESGFMLNDAGSDPQRFDTEDRAIEIAVRIAQEAEGPYTINYWRP